MSTYSGILRSPSVRGYSQAYFPAFTTEVEQLAALIVDFVKKNGVDSLKNRTRDPDGIERSKPEPLQDGRTKKKNRQ